MMDKGILRMGVFLPDATAPGETELPALASDHAEHTIVMTLSTDKVVLSIMVNRGDFSKALAERGYPIAFALNLEKKE